MSAGALLEGETIHKAFVLSCHTLSQGWRVKKKAAILKVHVLVFISLLVLSEVLNQTCERNGCRRCGVQYCLWGWYHTLLVVSSLSSCVKGCGGLGIGP